MKEWMNEIMNLKNGIFQNICQGMFQNWAFEP